MKTDSAKQKSIQKIRHRLLISINLLFVIMILSLFLYHNAVFHTRIYEQNITDITNINKSTATLAAATFRYHSLKIADITKYIQYMDLSLQQTLEYIYNSCSNPENSFEIIGTDNTGYLAEKDEKGDFIHLSYQNNSYTQLQHIFQTASQNNGIVSYSPEFTDAFTAYKSFAIYSCLPLKDGTGHKSFYTIMLISKSSVYITSLHKENGYKDYATMLMDKNGNYILGDKEFKSNNLFKYLYIFNDLSLDEKKVLAAKVMSTQAGKLTYNNSTGIQCIYVYYKYPESNWYSVSCVPESSFHNIKSEKGFAILIALILTTMMLTDILWLNSLNRKLRLSIIHEKAANKAKSDFLSRMSHDMRTPLNAVLGFTALSKESRNLPPELANNLNKIDMSARYLLSIINDVLDMSKIESGKIELHEETVDYPKMLADIMEMFSGEAERQNIEISTSFTLPTKLYLVLDPLRMRQIYSNLLSNALKFSNPGTEIAWSVKAEQIEKDRYKITSVINDHGCGMSSKFMAHLFEPFSQEQNIHSSSTTGTGLGLAIVKRLIALMGGTITADSTLGKGTEFTLAIESQTGNPVQESEMQNRKNDMETILSGKRVLLCEDNLLNREIAGMMLNSRKVICETAENGEQGIEKFKLSVSGYYDAILMDIRMPVMNGIDAARTIRKLNHPDAKTVPIIAMTANAYDDDVKASLDAGMNAHLAKPIEPDKLFQTLADLMHNI